MNNWDKVYQYFRVQGIPHQVLSTICIRREEATQISSIIEKISAQTILEVGTFIGLSTGVIGLASLPGSTFVCIDPNLPVAALTSHFNDTESRGTLDFVRKMLGHFGLDQRTIVLEGFFSRFPAWAKEKIIAQGSDPAQVTIIREEVGKYAPYNLVFMDGDHDADAVYSDLTLICPYLAQDGIIVLHDVNKAWEWGEQVQKGIAYFIEIHPEFSLITDHNLGFLSRDNDKSWFVRQKNPPIIKKVKRKVESLLNACI